MVTLKPNLNHQLDCSLDLRRRLPFFPPQQIEQNMKELIDLVPGLCEDILTLFDQPFKIARDKMTGKDYLLCDYNRDADSYRSPWSNKYDPPLDDGGVPSDEIRRLEILANQVFDKYREIYFEGGLSSVYLWDLDDGFAGVILLKKVTDTDGIKGCWDSMHVIEVHEKGRSGHYKLTSTMMLWLQSIKAASGEMNLGGSLLVELEEDNPISFENAHIHNIARMVEKMENRIRERTHKIYFEKTNDIISSLRSPERIEGR